MPGKKTKKYFISVTGDQLWFWEDYREHEWRYRITWFRDNMRAEDISTYDTPVHPADDDDAAWESWIAIDYAKKWFDGRDDVGWYFRSISKVRVILAQIKKIIIAGKRRPLPEWAQRAVIEGWRPPPEKKKKR